MPPKRPKALSLFSGIGGFCESFRLAGFEVVGAVENDRYAAQNYRTNFPETALYEGDVCEFLSEEDERLRAEHLSEYIGEGPIDVVFGGPPCQGFSQIGPRDVDDPRNALYEQFCRIVRAVQPSFVVIENVPNMFMMNKGHFKEAIFQELRQSGYGNIGWAKLNAAHYGVPQERQRIFIVAAKDGLLRSPAQDLLDHSASSLVRNQVSVGDAISDLPETVASDSGVALPYADKRVVTAYQREMRIDHSGHFYSQALKTERLTACGAELALHNHHTKEIQEKRLKLIKLLQPGAKANSLPKEVWNNARPEKWRRFDEKRPAHTLLAQMHRDLSEWVHPKWDRWITVREALRLQSFHDGFVLRTSEWQQLKQVGNAVPPLLGYVPAMAAMYGITSLRGQDRPFASAGQTNLFF